MRVVLLPCLVLALAVPSLASAEELATPCTPDALTCAAAPIAFAKEMELPIEGGFDTGWVPAGSPLQVHLFAQLYASTFVELAGRLETSWPEALELEAVPTPGAGALGIHYGVEVGAEAMVQIEVLGQTYTWTGPIPYIPQFDFQVEAETPFDPWAFGGVTVGGSSSEATLAQVSATDFIGVNIPGLDGGFELNVKMDLDATYRTEQIRVLDPEGMLVAGGAILSETPPITSALYPGGPSVEYDVQPVGAVVYDGVLHLIPAFYIETIGPDFSIPIADIPIPFSIEQKNWLFDAVRVHVPLPDVALPGDPEAPTGQGEFALGPALDFGDVAVGSSAAVMVDIHNFGEAPLVGGLAADDPAFQPAASALTVGPGAKATVEVSFLPTSAGEITATLVLASNDPDEPSREITLRGNAIGGGAEDPAADPPVEEARLDDGCDCRQAGSRSDAWGIFGLLGAAALLRRRARP